MNTPGTTGPRRSPRVPKAPAEQVHRITTAADSLRDDQARRAKRYLIQMTIRMVCIIAAFFSSGLLMWIFMAGAIVLPYIAVIEANGGRDKREDGDPLMEYHQLPSTPGTPRRPTGDSDD